MHYVDKDSFVSLKPKDLRLSSAIAYYYLHETFAYEHAASIVYYPHYFSTLNVYLDAHVILTDEGRIISGNAHGQKSCYLTRNRNKSRTVEMRGAVKKLGIVFQPLGLFFFLSSKFSLGFETAQRFEYFGSAILDIGEDVFTLASAEEQVRLLDDFFVERLMPFADENIAKAVQLLFDRKCRVSVQEMADQVGVHRKTLLRLFKKYLGCSVAKFRAVVQFRQAVDQYHADQKIKFSELAFLQCLL